MTTKWERFWFEPEPTSSLAVLRIAFGLLALAWTVSLAGDLDAFFSRGGLLPAQPGGAGTWGVLAVFPSNLAVQLVFVALLVACLCLIVGYQTRLAALLVFAGMLSLQRRNLYVFNTGDVLLKLIAFYMVLAPSGASLSLDRWRTERERFWEFPLRAPWALKLMQIQLSILYLAGLWIKVQGTDWNNGTAVGYSLRISDLSRFPLPGFLIHSAMMSNLLTYGTLAVEASVPILVWNRRLRPWALLAGACLHLGIAWSIRIGFFSLGMLTLYLSFLEPHWAQAKLLHLRGLWRARERASSRSGAPALPMTPAVSPLPPSHDRQPTHDH